MVLNTTTKALIGAIVALVLAVGYLTWRARRVEGKLREESLGRINDKALADRSKAVLLKALGDTAVAQQRLVIQERQRIDALARQIGGMQVSITNLTATVKKLDTTNISGTTTTNLDSSKTTTFAVRQPPFTVDARVIHRSSTQPIMSRLTIGVDPARMQLRLTCGDLLPGGVRPAQATLITPPWITARLDTLSQSVDVCSRDKREGHWSLGVTAGYGAVWSPLKDSSGVTRNVHHGPSVTGGITYRFNLPSLWPF